MPRSRCRTSSFPGLLLVISLVLAGFFAQAAQAETEPTRYVALGDSYSAASGLLPLDPAASPQCQRSSLNYPKLVAEDLGADLVDVTCGGAETADYFTSQHPGVAPQLDAVESDTELITMTIGGNDSGVFMNAIAQCGSAGLASVGQGSPCKDQYGTSFEDTVRDTTYPAIVGALEAVSDKAPGAKVVILGYPWIVPETDGCFPTMPVAEGDVPYLRSLQTTLNDAVSRAADATGATFVDLGLASDGRDACKPIGTRWVEPVLAGTNPVIVHPNAMGEAGMAAEALSAITAKDGNPGQKVRPRTRITRLVIKATKRRAVFRFRSSKPGSKFRCRLDRGRYRKCTSPKVYRRLKPGRHRFRVMAVSRNGLRDRTPAVNRFRIPR